MVVKRGQHTGTKNAILMLFTCAVLGLSWKGRVPNTSKLQTTGSYDLITIIRHRCLRWTGRASDGGQLPAKASSV